MTQQSESIFNYYQSKADWNKLIHDLGLDIDDISNDQAVLREYINLKLMTLGLAPIHDIEAVLNTPTANKAMRKPTVSDVAQDLINSLMGLQQIMSQMLPPVDCRLQNFIDKTFPLDLLPEGLNMQLKLPNQLNTFQIDRANVAFELATPLDRNYYSADGNQNFRIPQGLLSNPKSDKRSTVGTFHVCTGGCKISMDKFEVPLRTTTYMLAQALNPPHRSLEMPFTSTQPENNKAYCWTSVYLTPPVIPGLSTDRKQPHIQKNMDVRFFAPASFVANLGFVEQIFCNHGNPMARDMMATSPDRYSGVTCLIILAPHLTTITKKECGLPKWEDATPKQRADKMCWKAENELYNDGRAFKLCYRSPDEKIVMTIIADTYFGYSKKEIKTMISFAANIIGFSQEEHAGGCYISPVYSWGRSFKSSDTRSGLYKSTMHRTTSTINLTEMKVEEKVIKPISQTYISRTFDEVKKLFGQKVVYNAELGYLTDRAFPNIIYLPEMVSIELNDRVVTYQHPDTGKQMTMKIKQEAIYMLPNGYQVQLIRHPISNEWMLLGTEPDVKFLFKPASVSGAGKSELSKAVMDAVTSGPFIIKDFQRTMTETDEILNYDYSKRFRPEQQFDYKAAGRTTRHILCSERSLGSVIQLLTPDEDVYNEEFNAWIRKMHPDTISFVFLVKSRYRPEWGDYNSWKQHFRLDKVNGHDGYALKCQGLEVHCTYLRVGQEKVEGNWCWRNFRLRQDFYPGVRFQNNDDIGVSLVANGSLLQKMSPQQKFSANRSYKLTSNCEYRYFQRPDDACHPGVDKKCESDLGRLDGKTLISNFEPINREFCKELKEDVMKLEIYTKPMQNVVKRFADGEFEMEHVVVSSEFRITNPQTNGRSNNVRYLQTRDELIDQHVLQDKYLIEIRKRLEQNIPFTDPVILPVDVYVPGRRLNTIDPKEKAVRPLSVYGPIHYQPIPYLLLDWLVSLSGKSPSTTGSGSLEGALTKGPFNNMPMSIDLNYACLALVLGSEPVLTTAAGSVGHKLKVEHDITVLIPEIISRMTPAELKIESLIKEGSLEKVNDMEFNGKQIHSSILGYRVTKRFVKKYFARIFDYVDGLFAEEHLKPELQSMENFQNGVDFIYENIQQCVSEYYQDKSFEELIPPLQILFNIIKNGQCDGMKINDEKFLQLFTRDAVLGSGWYQKRLVQAKRNDVAALQKQIKELKELKVSTKELEERLEYVASEKYLVDIQGSMGVHVFAEEE